MAATYTGPMSDTPPVRRHHQIDANDTVSTVNRARVAEDLLIAARSFFPEAEMVEPVIDRDDLARVRTPSHVWRIRRWPESAPLQRIELVHATLRAAHAAGIDVVPDVGSLPGSAATIFTKAGIRYDAQRWPDDEALMVGRF